MDPVVFLCTRKPVPPAEEIISWYYTVESRNPKISNPEYLNPKLYKKVKKSEKNSKELLDDPEFQQITDPFKKVKDLSGIKFINVFGVILANIDAVFNIVGTLASYLEPTDVTPLRFACINETNELAGGDVQYLQYRRPNCQGWGLTGVKAKGWNKTLINLDRFNIQYGTEDTNKANYEYLISSVLGKMSQGIDFVTIQAKDIFWALGIGTRILAIHGNLVAQVNPETDAYAIFLTSTVFEKITLFKPVTSSPVNNVMYLICEDRKEKYTDPFTPIVTSNTEPGKVTEKFVTWFSEIYTCL